MRPKDVDEMANGVDPDQTAPEGAVWSGSTRFTQTCLSKNLVSLRYQFGSSEELVKTANEDYGMKSDNMVWS